MILQDRAAEELASLLNEDDFYYPAHRHVFRAIRQLLNSAKPIDLISLKSELAARGTLDDIGGVAYLIQLAEVVPSAAHHMHYASIVQDLATLRRLDSAGREITGLVHNTELEPEEKVDQAERLLFEVGLRRLGRQFSHVRDLAKDFFIDVDQLVETGEPILGLPSGFLDLDAKTTGFYGGDFIIVAARPSMGKTSLVLNFALHAAMQGKGNVAVFSLEMSAAQLVRRMVSMLAGVSGHILKRPPLSTQNYEKLADACETIYNLPIYVDDSSDINSMEMRGKCRRLKADGGLALVVVDYLQLMRGSRRTENRVQEISDIARSLKALAKELDVPVIALSQLNRGVENRDDKRPQLADIRESGSIEAEADLVMFIYREQYYADKAAWKEGTRPQHEYGTTDEAEIIIAKHRNGPTGKVILGFQSDFARFVNLERDRDPYEE